MFTLGNAADRSPRPVLVPAVRARLAVALAAMAALHAVIAWQEWRFVPAGFPDFSIFYTAGTILRQGNGGRLYQEPYQEAVQRSFAPAVDERGAMLPFNHPPFEAVFFVPLTFLSYLPAYLVFMVFNLACLAAVVLLLRRSLVHLGALPLWLWILAVFGFTPLFVALFQGQDSIFLLLCYAAAFFALERDREFAAGCALGLGLCKFHLLLPFIVPFVVFRRWRVLAGFASTAAALGLVALAAVGPHGLADYPRFVWTAEHSLRYHWNLLHGDTPNLRGLFLTLAGQGNSPAVDRLVFVASALLLAVTAWLWGRSASGRVQGQRLAFVLSLLATILVSFHAYVQDLSLLFLALPITLEWRQDAAGASPALQRTLLACCGLLFCAPLYLVLILRYSRLGLLAIVLIVWYAALAIALPRLSARPMTTA